MLRFEGTVRAGARWNVRIEAARTTIEDVGTSVEDHCTVKCGGKLIWEQTLESLKAC